MLTINQTQIKFALYTAIMFLSLIFGSLCFFEFVVGPYIPYKVLGIVFTSMYGLAFSTWIGVVLYHFYTKKKIFELLENERSIDYFFIYAMVYSFFFAIQCFKIALLHTSGPLENPLRNSSISVFLTISFSLILFNIYTWIECYHSYSHLMKKEAENNSNGKELIPLNDLKENQNIDNNNPSPFYDKQNFNDYK